MKTDYFDTLENPFIIDIEEKEEYTLEDYIEIQKKLDQKNTELDPFIESLYTYPTIYPLDEIKRRTKKGVTQKIIDVSNNVLPTKQVFKVGDGGDGKRCFVCCTPLASDRCDASKSVLQSLEEVGFNGYFLLLNGGFPNPTGKEMKYIGVPYSFKIFMMLEAKKMGFEKVIWIDAACYALNNVDRLFEVLEEDDALFKSFHANCFLPDSCKHYILPKTIEYLSSLVGRDIHNDRNVNSIVFGLNLSSPKIISFIDEYYKMVEIGLPFLSHFPEEMVFTSLFNKPEYKYVFNNSHKVDKLYVHECYQNKQYARQQGYYFSQRQY